MSQIERLHPSWPTLSPRRKAAALLLLVAGLTMLAVALARGEARRASHEQSLDPTDGGAPPAPGKAIPVHVGVHLLRVDKLDIGLGSYTMDFYLSFRCDRPCNPGEFEFANGQAIVSIPERHTPTHKVFRVQATLTENLNLRAYPFDRHRLTLALEDRVHTTDALVYLVDPRHTALDDDFVLPGWSLAGDWLARAADQNYPALDATYSRYSFGIEVRRPLMSAVLKGVAPALLIMLAGFLPLLLGPDSAAQRLGLGASVLISTVLYHLTFTSALPPVPYLTFADRLMLVNYGALVLGLTSTVMLEVLRRGQHAGAVRRVWWVALVGIPSLWLILQAANAAAL